MSDNQWTEGAVKAWEERNRHAHYGFAGITVRWRKRADGYIETQEQTLPGGDWTEWQEARSREHELDGDKTVTPVPVLPAPPPPVAEPAPITNNDDDGKPDPKMEAFWGWVKEIKATAKIEDAPPAPPQRDPDRLSAERFLSAVVSLLDAGNVADRDIEWAVNVVKGLESRLVKHPVIARELLDRRRP